jgi:hypothetical protein
MAVPAYDEHITEISTTNVTSFTFDYGDFTTSPANGDDLVAFVGIDRDDGTGTTLTGFDVDEEVWMDAGSAGLYAMMAHRNADGTESGTITCSFGSSANDSFSAVMLKYNDSDGATAPPTSSSDEGATTAPSAPGDVLDNGDTYRVIVAYLCNSNANNYSSDPTGYTNRINTGSDSTRISLAVADDDITGDGSTTYGDEAWTTSASRETGAFSIALKESTSGGSAIVKVLDEAVSIPSGTKWIRGLTTLLGEDVSIVEANLRALGLVRQSNDVEAVVDGQKKVLGLVRAKAEVEAVVDTIIKLLGLVRERAETVEIVESPQRVLGLLKLSDETVEILTSSLSLRGLVRFYDEVEAIQEGKLNIRGLIQLIAETVAIEEGFVSKLTAVVIGAILGLQHEYYNIKGKVSGLGYTIRSKIKATFKSGNGRESSV